MKPFVKLNRPFIKESLPLGVMGVYQMLSVCHYFCFLSNKRGEGSYGQTPAVFLHEPVKTVICDHTSLIIT